MVAGLAACAVRSTCSRAPPASHALKRMGIRVHANDHNAYAGVLATCYVQADRERWQPRAERLIAELDALPGEPGWFTETYCRRARYLRPENGARVDAIRERIALLDLEPELEAIALTSLMEAADRVDSTTGVQMAYLKQWAPRAYRPLALRVPELLPGPGSASCLDALEAARRFEGMARTRPALQPTLLRATITCGSRWCDGIGRSLRRGDESSGRPRAREPLQPPRRIQEALASLVGSMQRASSSFRSTTRATSSPTSCARSSPPWGGALGRHPYRVTSGADRDPQPSRGVVGTPGRLVTSSVYSCRDRKRAEPVE